jgi:hypothetical protein
VEAVVILFFSVNGEENEVVVVGGALSPDRLNVTELFSTVSLFSRAGLHLDYNQCSLSEGDKEVQATFFALVALQHPNLGFNREAVNRRKGGALTGVNAK